MWGETVEVHLGVTRNGSSSTIMRVDASNQHIFPEFSAMRHANDIGRSILKNQIEAFPSKPILLSPCNIPTALLKLPEAISEYSLNIKPIPLPTNCNSVHMGNERVIAIGTGLNKIDPPVADNRLRHANFITMTPADCQRTVRGARNTKSILCARPSNGRTVFFGDSGGPLLRESDSHLIGAMSFIQMDETFENVELQVFTNIFYYFDWISQVTQLDLTACEGPQAIIATDDD